MGVKALPRKEFYMNNENTTLRAALYMRYSSVARNDGFSIEAQQKALKKYARANNYIVTKEYIDKAKTGTNANRPQFQKMIEDSKKRFI